MPLSEQEKIRMLEAARLQASVRSKSPAVAGLLSFFFPVFGMLYVRRYGMAVLFFFLDGFFLLLWVIGIGILLTFLFRIMAVIAATTGVNNLYVKNLDRQIQTVSNQASTVQTFNDQPIPTNSYQEAAPKPAQAPAFCGSCGTPLGLNLNYCEDCGTPVVAR